MRASLLALASLLLGACATSENAARVEHDPWEGFNRASYAVNDFGDRYLLKPVSRGYRWAIPSFMRRGVTNFSENLATPRSAVNNFLQGKPRRGFSDVTRFLFNSTIGILGVVDVATLGGLEKYNEDWGQTFAVWGVPDGPFVFVPLLGPQTLRDAVSLPLEIVSDPLWHYENSSVRDPLYVLRIIDTRARLLSAEALLQDSRDPYLTIRESFLQNRRFQIYDGDPPEDEDFYDDFYDEFEEDFEDEDPPAE